MTTRAIELKHWWAPFTHGFWRFTKIVLMSDREEANQEILLSVASITVNLNQ